MTNITVEERRRRSAVAAATRAASIADTRPTTRAGSEFTDLVVGDRVRAARATGNIGTWARYDDREGWVSAVNRQEFPSGVSYVEIGVSWSPPNKGVASSSTWFRADELERLP